MKEMDEYFCYLDKLAKEINRKGIFTQDYLEEQLKYDKMIR